MGFMLYLESSSLALTCRWLYYKGSPLGVYRCLFLFALSSPGIYCTSHGLVRFVFVFKVLSSSP
jgi:hypothetical protein